MRPDQPQRSAIVSGALAYVVWGFLVLYWPLVASAQPLEILAHRIVWSLVWVVACLLLLRRRWTWLRTLRSHWVRLLIASVLIGANWLTYIWAINNGHVAEASLGYYLNPLVNVTLGVLLFGERSAPAGWLGVGFAAVGVAIIAVAMSGTIWVALTLAFSFGFYGAAKKGSTLGALEGLFVESAVLFVPALAFLLSLGAHNRFGQGSRETVLLVLCGAVTALPLWLFASAAPRIPFGLIGMLQYVAPTISLILGVTWFGQRVPHVYWVGLALVWLGMALYLTSLFRRTRSPAREVSDRAVGTG